MRGAFWLVFFSEIRVSVGVKASDFGLDIWKGSAAFSPSFLCWTTDGAIWRNLHDDFERQLPVRRYILHCLLIGFASIFFWVLI